MYDPLQAVASSSSSNGDSNARVQGSTSNAVVSPPATPSKSRLSSRPPPYQRPPASQQQEAQQQVSPQHMPQHLSQHPHILRSQSPLAPRPPLPGQPPRPVSPHHFQQQQQQQQSQLHGYQVQASSSLSPPGSSTSSAFAPYSPAGPNAWASSAPAQGIPQHFTAPTPSPLPLPSPVGFGSPTSAQASASSSQQRRGNSPGIPRSPLAESSGRSILANQSHPQSGDYERDAAYSNGQPVQQKERAPPFIRIRIQGIDRAKKELGIKMDCQTNIPTYHRQHSPIFSRTYAEFSSLHSALSSNHPETILPALPLAQTSATTEEEEDRFLRIIFARFVERICRDKALILDDELRAFVEADFGYTPLTRAKKLKSSSGFLSRSGSKHLLSEDGEPDFLLSAKVHSATLEASIQETTKSLERSLKANALAASSYAELSASLGSYSTTEAHAPLAKGLKTLAESMRTIAELEVGQCNASALVFGDALSYEAVEARSAKDALLQRQYNLDELHSSIKATITKRRNIEKLRGSGSGTIKAERVSEALEDLEEAAKAEQALNSKVQAISNNLRPALQNHLKTMNTDLLNALAHHARTQLAFENKKLQIYKEVNGRVKGIPEKIDQNAVYYHQPQQTVTDGAGSSMINGDSSSVSTLTGSRGGGSQSAAIPPATLADPSASARLPPQQAAASAGAAASSVEQSKFFATQAQIKAAMEAQQAAEKAAQEERLRQREQQLQRKRMGQAPAGTTGMSRSSSANSSISQQQAGQNSPFKPASAGLQAQGPLSAPQAGLPSSLPTSTSSKTSADAAGPLGAQSMFLPASSARPILRSPPSSPSRSASRLPAQQSNVQIGPSSQEYDPLFGGPRPVRTAGSASQPGMSNEGGLAQSTYMPTGPLASHPAQQQYHVPSAGPPSNMAQSVFLPGRSANAGRQAPASNSVEDRKRADARKAASLLAGAF